MKDRILWLSHPLSPDTPAYGGGQGMTVSPETRISRGDSANTSRWSLPNHFGTHLDAPLHFFDDGMAISDLPADFFIFHHVQLVDITCKEGTLIGETELPEPIKPDTALLLLRTGFEQYREHDRYWQENPGLAPELGEWLREQFPQLAAVGIDTISITSRSHRQEGRLAHAAFLDPNGRGQPILLIEDMALARAPQSLSMVVVAPLMVAGADGGPCTVLGFYS